MSRACEQFPCKTGGATDWGSATLGRPRGRGFKKNNVVLTDTNDVVCNGTGQVVAALVEDARMLGRINLVGRVGGPGEMVRTCSPPLVKPQLRLVAVKDDEGRIRMKPLDDPPNKSDRSGMENGKKERTKMEPEEDGWAEKRNARRECKTANDATALRGITMKDGVGVAGLEQNSTNGSMFKANNKIGAELNGTKGKVPVSEMMSTQAGYTIKRISLKSDLEKKVEKCFLCGQPSEDQVRKIYY